MRQTTAKYELIQVRLGRDLRAYVTERTRTGAGIRPISADLSTITGVTVSRESLRVWFPELFHREQVSK